MSDRESVKDQTDGWVYFIQAGQAGPIKIGWSKNPLSRLRALQISQHQTLRLLGIVPGSRAEEKLLHRRFARWRLSGEWFERGKVLPDIMRHILDHGYPALLDRKSRNSSGKKHQLQYNFVISNT